VTSSLELTSPPEDTVSAERLPRFPEAQTRADAAARQHLSTLRSRSSRARVGARAQLGAPLPHERCSTSLSAPMDGRCPLGRDRLYPVDAGGSGNLRFRSHHPQVLRRPSVSTSKVGRPNGTNGLRQPQVWRRGCRFSVTRALRRVPIQEGVLRR